MVLTRDGKMAGSVSGGCVEGAVYEAGTQVLKSGQPELLYFGVADETAWEVGLACGGKIEVFVEPLDATLYAAVHEAIVNEQPVATITVVKGPVETLGRKLVLQGDERTGSLGGDLEGAAIEAAREALTEGKPRRVNLDGPDTDAEAVELFVDVVLPSPTLIVVGGVVRGTCFQEND